jgi:hypothetical protein
MENVMLVIRELWIHLLFKFKRIHKIWEANGGTVYFHKKKARLYKDRSFLELEPGVQATFERSFVCERVHMLEKRYYWDHNLYAKIRSTKTIGGRVDINLLVKDYFRIIDIDTLDYIFFWVDVVPETLPNRENGCVVPKAKWDIHFEMK